MTKLKSATYLTTKDGKRIMSIDDKLIHSSEEVDDWVTLYDAKTGKPRICIQLTEAGKVAYFNGEKLEWDKGHFTTTMDLSRICLAEL
jgi:hypothetical protein